MDFTLHAYGKILQSIVKQEYISDVFSNVNWSEKENLVFLRHDVDRLPHNSLKMAQIEANLGIKSIYYFRIVNHVFKPEIIKRVAALGHEIGYHYEDLTLAKGNVDRAYDSFGRNLDKFRALYPVKNICMHGSPMSPWDSKKIWDKYDYKKLGIEMEPYFDIDYNEVFYITDTGRKWNNSSISVRDKVNSGFDIPIKSTDHLIQLIQDNILPNKIMINTHPHRWFDPGIGWTKELVMQNVKNVAKYFLVKIRK